MCAEVFNFRHNLRVPWKIKMQDVTGGTCLIGIMQTREGKGQNAFRMRMERVVLVCGSMFINESKMKN